MEFLTEKNINKGYTFFYTKVYKERFNPSDTTSKLANKFIQHWVDKKVIHSIQKDFLWRYLLFQFSYWDECEIEQYNKKVNYSFIFGPKALQRYLDRKVEFDFLLSVDNKFLHKYKISYKEFSTLYVTKSSNVSKLVYNNVIRRMKLNTETGLYTCTSNFLFYTTTDESCLLCNYKIQCQQIKKENNL